MKAEDQIFETLRRMAVLKGVEVSQERLNLMSKALAGFGAGSVLGACKELSVRTKFFPDISEIVAIIKPPVSPDDQGQHVAAEIFKAIRRFGQYQSSEAEKYLGKEVWDIVSEIGGWLTLCETNIKNVSILRAQIRDLGKSHSKVNPRLDYIAMTNKREAIESENKEVKNIQ